MSGVNSTVYLKYYGDEVYFNTFNSSSIIEIISQLQHKAKSRGSWTNGNLWMENGHSIPSQIGLPLHINATGVFASYMNTSLSFNFGQLLNVLDNKKISWNCSFTHRFDNYKYK